jgi:mono/diheme cytochrome c family protein
MTCTSERPRLGMMAIFAAAVVLSASGCRPTLPPSKALSELTPQEASGYAIFQSHCARCHHANSQDGLRGPGLQGLYKQKYLPSGAPANDDRVTSAILHGRGMMPSFANDLDDQQVNDLLAYLHTL